MLRLASGEVRRVKPRTGLHVRIKEITRHLLLLSPFVVLPLLWGAAPDASQDDANEGFILFTSDRANPSNAGVCSNCEDIYAMRPDGTSLDGTGEPTRLTHGGGAVTDPDAYNSAGADWSHSKKLIAFHTGRGGFPEIFLMNPDGSEQLALASLGATGALFPSFSHSGNELCFSSRVRPRDIYIVNVHGTGLTNLTNQTGDNSRCDWSPKSNAIAFATDRDDPPGTLPVNRNDEIYVMNADGSDVLRLTGTTAEPVPGADVNPAWSPKGDRIAFESNRTGKPEIWIMNADGTNLTRLTNFDGETTPSNFSVTKPTWSPTGDRIAFHRRVGPTGVRGHLEIYTIVVGANMAATQITVTTAPGFSGFPAWAKWSNQ
jgi:TolB protein